MKFDQDFIKILENIKIVFYEIKHDDAMQKGEKITEKGGSSLVRRQTKNVDERER